MKEFFSSKGRLTRSQYIISLLFKLILPIFGIIFLFSIIFGFIIGRNYKGPESGAGLITILTIIIIISTIFMFYMGIIFAIKRLHDINQSGYLSILLFFPVVGFILFVYLLFAPSMNSGETYNEIEIIGEGNVITSNQQGKRPVGFTILLILIGYGICSTIIAIIIKLPIIQVGPYILTGAYGLAMWIITIVFISMVFISILKRFSWGWNLSLVYHIYGIILININAFYLYYDKVFFEKYIRIMFYDGHTDIKIFNFSPIIFILMAVFGTIYNGIVFYYIYKRRDYFVN